MTEKMARAWTQSFASLRDDERGVETTKVILILVVVVLGLAGAFFVLRNMMAQKEGSTLPCINGRGQDGELC